MTKIWKPTDFPKPTPDATRAELATAIDAVLSDNGGNVTFAAGKVMIECIISFRTISTEEMIDFCSWYARQGSWKNVTGIRQKTESISHSYKFTLSN